MTIDITPEDLKLSPKRIESGVFVNMREVIHHGLVSQDAAECWLQDNKQVISEEIARGID